MRKVYKREQHEGAGLAYTGRVKRPARESTEHEDLKGGHPMTLIEATRIRARWRGQSALETCRHLTLELEFNSYGDSTDNYVCILCGEPAAQRSLVA
jgi:hypothetical protein